MRFVTLILVCAFIMSGCSGVRTYTYKQERVDQQMKGNQGYFQGNPPPAESREGLKRDMVGVDVVIPIMPWEKSASVPPAPKKGTVEVPPKEEEKTVMQIPAKRKPEPVKKVVHETQEKVEQIKGEAITDDTNGEWIKGEYVSDEDEWVK